MRFGTFHSTVHVTQGGLSHTFSGGQGFESCLELSGGGVGTHLTNSVQRLDGSSLVSVVVDVITTLLFVVTAEAENKEYTNYISLI